MKQTAFLCLLIFAAHILSAQDNVEWRYDRTGVYKESGLLKSWSDNEPELL